MANQPEVLELRMRVKILPEQKPYFVPEALVLEESGDYSISNIFRNQYKFSQADINKYKVQYGKFLEWRGVVVDKYGAGFNRRLDEKGYRTLKKAQEVIKIYKEKNGISW